MEVLCWKAQDWHFGESQVACSAPATVAFHDPVVVVDEDRLKEPVFGDGLREIVQPMLRLPTRLAVWLEFVYFAVLDF